MNLMDQIKSASKDLSAKAQEAIDKKLDEREATKQAAAEQTAEIKHMKKSFITTKVLGDLELDMENELFKINHARIGMQQKSGVMKKTGKAVAAIYTIGASVIIEKTMMQPGDKIFKFNELLSYELFEDDSQVTKGGLGLAAAGGILFGGVGAIVGGVTGKRKTKRNVESLYLKINLNNIDFPCAMIPYITKSTKTKSNDYINAFNSAQETISCLNIILKKLETDGITTPEAPMMDDPLTQVKKLKELLDMDAITQEEFDVKKKELLNL